MKFEEALALIKAGKAVERGEDSAFMRVYLVKGSIDDKAPFIALSPDLADDSTSSIPLSLFEAGDRGTHTRLPRLDAVDVNGNTVTGWTPTATDLLATNWKEVEADDLSADDDD